MSADYSNVVCLSKYREEKEEREFQEYMEYLQALASYFAEEFPPDIVRGIILSLEEHLSGERGQL